MARRKPASPPPARLPFPGARRRNGRTETPPHAYCVRCERPINKWGGVCIDCQLAEAEEKHPPDRADG